jgi:hypothetical protein
LDLYVTTILKCPTTSSKCPTTASTSSTTRYEHSVAATTSASTIACCKLD